MKYIRSIYTRMIDITSREDFHKKEIPSTKTITIQWGRLVIEFECSANECNSEDEIFAYAKDLMSKLKD